MRVKVTYTVDSEEVLQEVKRLVNQKVMPLKPMLDLTAAHDFESTPIKDSLETLDHLRRKLFDLDATLMDVIGILNSYVQANFSEEGEAG